MCTFHRIGNSSVFVSHYLTFYMTILRKSLQSFVCEYLSGYTTNFINNATVTLKI